MNPYYKHYENEEEVVQAVNTLKADGVPEDDIYVITHDDERTDRIARHADANTVGANEVGIGTTIKNFFRKQGDELRAQFEELGFTHQEAEQLEEKLDEGKVILVVKNYTQQINL